MSYVSVADSELAAVVTFLKCARDPKAEVPPSTLST